MREFLFRGKRVSDNKWAYGSLLKVTIGHKSAYMIFGDDFIFAGDGVRALNHAMVDPATVGQFTGLTDKNGKKIFEGDIIENIDGRAIVFFDKTPCGFYMRFLDAYDDTPLDMGEMWDETEVIGNIHDNPELMGVE